MSINKDNAMLWVSRFLNGETTNDEEQQLYQFFAGDEVPAHLTQYREMFSWYANGMKEEDLPKSGKVIEMRNKGRRILQWGIAASILLAIGFGLGYHFNPDSPDYSQFEGSYIIRNGKKITDMNVIYEELLKVYKEQLKMELSWQDMDDSRFSPKEEDDAEGLPVI